MFGVSIPEILLVCAVILIVLGPDKLPGAVRKFGSFLAQFRKQTDSMRKELYNSMYEPAEEIRGEIERSREELRAVKKPLEDLEKLLSLDAKGLLTCEEKEELTKRKQEKELKAENKNNE